jgi:integrase
MKQRTDLYFRKAAARAERYELSDRDGLVMEVHPSGRKTWRYRYRLNGKREKVTLGPYPTISLEDARDLRREAEKMVVAGKSPATLKQERLQSETPNAIKFDTVEKLAMHWIETDLKVNNSKPRQDITYVERDILPVIGKRPPQSITPTDVWMCVEAVRLRGHGQAARRVLSVLKRIFECGREVGVIQNNPATVMRPVRVAPTSSRSRKLSELEIRQLDQAIESSRLATPMRLAIRLLLLVPARKGELVRARWDEIDFDLDTWTIPEDNAKMKKALVQKLPHQAVKLLKDLQVMASGSAWVLPSPKGRGRKPLSITALNAALRTVEGLPGGMVIHDLRRTVRTGLRELGVLDADAELCLNHRKTGVAGVYDKAERLEARYEALCKWADSVDRALGRSNVTPIRTTRTQRRVAGAA